MKLCWIVVLVGISIILVFLYSLFLFKETCKKYTILDYLRRRFHLGYYRLVSNEIPCRRMQ